MILRNIPARIVYRSEKLEKILRDLLDIQGELHKELFEEFNKKIETIKINDDEGKWLCRNNTKNSSISKTS